MALLIVFAACKGESPTSPTTTPVTGTQTTTPPSGATITLTVSNASPLVSSTSIVTATVSESGHPVANGTAVQFSTNLGTFTDIGTSGATIIKTTTNGVATATLTSGSPGAATVTATVNNASKTTIVTFSSTATTPTTPSTTPTVISITPTTGRPSGGETITITGTNFRAPVRVIFKCEGSASTPPDPTACSGQTTKDALVTSVTPTQITAITPPFDVPAGKAISLSVTVLVGAGSSTEASIVTSGAIIFTSPSLTPVIRGITPTSGPIGGGTRTTIIGDNFQAPVQVFFNAAEAQVISINFNQIIVMSPRASDTTPGGSGTVTGPVDVRVKNIGSGTEVTAASGFRYTPKMTITTISPTQGPIVGGTSVTIDGTGFDDPLAVTIAGVPAQVIRVSGTEVVARTLQPLNTACANLVGTITVLNTENGDTASSIPTFTYISPPVKVTTVVSPATPGSTTSVTVLNASGIPRITIGDKPATITGSTANSDGTTTFTIIVPTNLTLATQSCSAATGVSAQIPTAFNVTYLSLSTGCTDTFTNGLTVNPPAVPILTVSGIVVPFSGRIIPATLGPPAVPASVTVTPSSQTVTLVNTGSTPLTITSITPIGGTGTGCTRFTPPPPVPASALLQCDALPVTVSYNAPTTATAVADVCTFRFVTNAGTRDIQFVGTSQ